MDIKCRRTTCEHNRGYTCCACNVDIDNNAICKTYEYNQKENEELDLSKNIFESAPEYANSRHIRNVSLYCNAGKCLFNKEGKCQANGITVIDDNETSACATFIEDC